MSGPSSPALERYRKARAEAEELRLAKLRGALLDAVEVEAGRVARIRAVKKALSSMVKSLTPRLAATADAADVHGALSEAIARVCRRFAEEAE